MEQNRNCIEEREWLDSELSKRRDRKWLRYSSQIARRILAVLRERKEISQKDLGSKSGVTPQYISKVLKGQENLTLDTISKLSDALGVELITFPQYRYSAMPSYVNMEKRQVATVLTGYATNSQDDGESAFAQQCFTVTYGNLGMADKEVNFTLAV